MRLPRFFRLFSITVGHGLFRMGESLSLVSEPISFAVDDRLRRAWGRLDAPNALLVVQHRMRKTISKPL